MYVSLSGKENLQRRSPLVGENNPISENALRQYIQDQIDDNLGVHAHLTCKSRRSPNAKENIHMSTFRRLKPTNSVMGVLTWDKLAEQSTHKW